MTGDHLAGSGAGPVGDRTAELVVGVLGVGPGGVQGAGHLIEDAWQRPEQVLVPVQPNDLLEP